MDKQLAKVAVALAAACSSSPFAETFSGAVKRNDYMTLTSFRVDPRKYTCASSLKRDLALASFFKKTPFQIKGVDRKKAAREKFLKFEQHCCVTNLRFRRFLRGEFESTDEVVLDTFLQGVKKRVSRTLGPIPNDLLWSFGPGATFETKGLCCTIADKIENIPTHTPSLGPFLHSWSRTSWGRVTLGRQKSPQRVRGNRFTTVPKTAKEDRGICIEPSLNVAAQLPIGKYMRRRIKKVLRIDLVRGQEYHRDLVALASCDGSLATYDLSGASDTSALWFYRYLLPEDWFELLSSLRSPCTFFEGKWVFLEKFSSMGNGFTFELETLVFKCLMDELSMVFGTECAANYVYGDDIIIPTAMGPAAATVLKNCGYLINQDKSFADGSFRESCGADYLNGVNVRPHYVEKEPAEPHEWIALANGIRRMAHLEPGADFRGHPYYPAWCRALDAIPIHIRRLRGPERLGDLVIHDDESSWAQRVYPAYSRLDGKRPDGTLERHYFKSDDFLDSIPKECSGLGLRVPNTPGVFVNNGLRRIPVWSPVHRKVGWEHFYGSVVLATVVYGAGDSEGLIPRGAAAGYRVSWVYI